MKQTKYGPGSEIYNNSDSSEYSCIGVPYLNFSLLYQNVNLLVLLFKPFLLRRFTRKPLSHCADPGKEHYESIVGEGENACYQHFLLFPQCFLRNLKMHHFINIENVVCKGCEFGHV